MKEQKINEHRHTHKTNMIEKNYLVLLKFLKDLKTRILTSP